MANIDREQRQKESLCLTIDVEDWFHILESPVVPGIKHWSSLESRIERNLDKLLTLLDSYSAKCTFFWLGWLAERHKKLVRKCLTAGHEIASHGYAHVLAHEAGHKGFYEDITISRDILEDITGEPIRGFRAAGFCTTRETAWVFDMVKEAGYQYDASIFPAPHGHGGMPDGFLGPHFIETQSGYLLEIPSSVVEIFNHRFCLFGGGYLRLATRRMIKWGLNRLQADGQPLVVYVHPREIDPYHPRLPLPLSRRFKCYVRLKTTLSKLEWLCREYNVCSMLDTAENYIRSFYYEAKIPPVLSLVNTPQATESVHNGKAFVKSADKKSCRNRLLQVEGTMATFVNRDRRRSASEEQQLQMTYH